MSRRTYTKTQTLLHAAYIVFLSVSGLLASYSAAFALCHISCPEDKIAAGFTIFFAALLLSVDFFECRAMGARLYMNDEGLGVRRFGKTKVFLRWNEIKEIGIGNIPTPFGSKERAYFCDRTLDENEKTDLVTLKYHTVHFSYIPKEWYEEMCRRLPVPLPAEIREKYVG